METTSVHETCISIALYLVDRRWGGPEEGGWWFDCGTLADTEALGMRDATPRVFTATQIAAGDHQPFVAHLEREVERTGLNLARFPCDDVRSHGWYRPVLRDAPAADWSDHEPWQ